MTTDDPSLGWFILPSLTMGLERRGRGIGGFLQISEWNRNPLGHQSLPRKKEENKRKRVGGEKEKNKMNTDHDDDHFNFRGKQSPTLNENIEEVQTNFKYLTPPAI
ncbi:hypothetical protein PoB_003152200 [Plakobranchus ocellatus]|uniref:Uncharacterized protein n=1 Tax=Plakobranchus ocellatus TaxID=259542 RepID=A0AAV4ACL2_9GAST|nr:hypothetical protein PoB_003152200 [Plakobranchus ocellatus]